MDAIRRFFHLDELGTNVRTEVRAGVATFLAMSYIIFVQPAVLSAAGMDFGAVMAATCISAAIATICMGLLANYPIALAPAMGHNFFFVFTVCLAMKVPWQTALGAVFISGSIFIIVSFVGLRERVMHAVPSSLKNGIAVGIGLLIALIGFKDAGLVLPDPNAIVKIGNFAAPQTLLALAGLAIIAVLLAWRVRGAVLLTILAGTVLGMAGGIVPLPKDWHLVSAPPSLAPTFLKLDIAGAFKIGLVEVIFIFFFLDLFDTVGTLIGVGQQAGLMRDGKLPRARQALLSDAIGTVVGAALGTSTVTSYIESTAGTSEGGRSGLANMVTALLFLLALFFVPLVKIIGGGCAVNGTYFYPITAPVLIVIGSLMFANIREIHFDDATEAIPAFLALIIMPLTLSITDGIAFGFISYALLKLVTGRGREASPFVYVFSVLFLVRYAVTALH